MRKIFFFAWILSIILSACGGAGGSAVPASTISMDMSEFKFTPSELAVFSGKETTLELKNSGAVQHDFTILKQGAIPQTPFDHDKQAGDILAEFKLDAGQSGTFKFTLPAPGDYTFICGVPGHAEAGMKGKITAIQP